VSGHFAPPLRRQTRQRLNISGKLITRIAFVPRRRGGTAASLRLMVTWFPTGSPVSRRITRITARFNDPRFSQTDSSMTPTEFEHLDRDARLAVLAEVQHHFGLSEKYFKLARLHEWLLNRSNNSAATVR
jgi:hypothetical protein